MVRKFKRKQPLFRLPIIVSLGSGGGRILSQLDASPFRATKVAVNNSERDLALLGNSVHERICTGQDRAGSGMDVDKGRQDFLEHAKDLLDSVRNACRRRKFDEPDVLPVICTLGHGFGSGSAPEALRLFASEFPNTVLLAWMLTSFDFQGNEIKQRAYTSLRKCREANITVTPISNQVAARDLKLNPVTTSLSKLYAAINREIGSLMTALFSALTTTDGVVESMDRNDLRQIWSGESTLLGMTAYPGAASISADSIRLAESRFLVDVKRGEGPDQPTATYIIDGPGEVTVGQMSELNQVLMEERCDMSFFKPLIIQRPKPNTTFMLIKGRMKLAI